MQRVTCNITPKHGNFSRGHGLPPVQPGSDNRVHPKCQSSKTASAASQSPNQPVFELINPPGPAEGDADSNDTVGAEDSGSMGDQDRDSTMG